MIIRNRIKPYTFVIIAFTLIFLIYNASKDEDDHIWIDRLDKLEKRLFELQISNKIFEFVIKSTLTFFKREINKTINSHSSEENGLDYEPLRRKIYTDIRDLLYFVDGYFIKTKNSNTSAEKLDFESNVKWRIKHLLASFYNLTKADNLESWRQNTSLKLKEYAKEKIQKIQNPSVCPHENEISVCWLYDCGFGCEMHHILKCFMTSFMQQKPVLIDSSKWKYLLDGYEIFFMPISNKCKLMKKSTTSNIVIIGDVAPPKYRFLPLAIPSDFAEELKLLHGNPYVWWSGHILNYVLRPRPYLQKYINKMIKTIGYQSPCVGVQIRRTDKVTNFEAKYHMLSEYMKYVEEFFDIYQLTYPNKNINRTVFIATDDAKVIDEAISNFTDYNFIFNNGSAQEAAVNDRYQNKSFISLMVDIHLLSQCDFLVCTFSSNLCRLVYELMQVKHVDASWRVQSLDDVFYVDGQNIHYVMAVADNKLGPDSENEFDMKVGDIIQLYGNHWNGYSKGRKAIDQLVGLFPSYKVKDTIEIVNTQLLF